jgi:hypothetical protein
MSTEIFTEVIKYEKNQIWIKPICDFFNISYENQTRVIKSDAILSNQSIKMSNSLVFGDNYRRVLLTKKGFVRWIQILNSNLIDVDLRDKFLQFQESIFDFIYGNLEEKEIAASKQQRLAKLKKLESKIKNEIRICQKDLSLYINKEFQYTLGI